MYLFIYSYMCIYIYVSPPNRCGVPVSNVPLKQSYAISTSMCCYSYAMRALK